MSELIDNSPVTDLTRRNYQLILVSIFLEKIAFYGFRSIIIFYAVFVLKVDETNAMFFYGYYLITSAVSSLIGGILSDFISNSKIILIISGSLSVLGALLSFFSDPVILLIGIGLILVGSGFYRATSFSYVGHLSLYRPVLLERRFIAGVGVINLGAFLGAFGLNWVMYEFGYNISFAAIAVLYALSLIILFTLKPSETIQSVLNREDQVQLVPVRGNTKFVLLTILGISFIWFVFELYGTLLNASNITYHLQLFGMRVPDTAIFIVGPAFTLLLIVPYYFFAHKIPLTIKLAIGSAIIAAVWFFAQTSVQSGLVELTWVPFLMFGFIEGIVDLLLTSALLTFICQHTPKKHYATLFGVYSFLAAIAIKLATYFSENKNDYDLTVPVSVILIAVLAFLILVPKELKHHKIHSSETKKDLL